MPRYNHAYTVGFELISNHPAGDDVTAQDLKAALLKRIESLDSAGDFEWLEATGAPFDTHEED